MDYHELQDVTRTVTLRDHAFRAKPTMAAPDFGLLSMVESGTYQGDVFEAASRAIRNTLVPDDRPKWDKLWADQNDETVPISIFEVLGLGNQLIQEVTGRPTQSPSPSGNGEGRITTSSTGASASQEEQVSAIST